MAGTNGLTVGQREYAEKAVLYNISRIAEQAEMSSYHFCRHI